jgi:hypothetical protein
MRNCLGSCSEYISPDRVTPHSAGNISRLLCGTLWRKVSTKEKQNAESNRNMKRKLQIIIGASAASVLALSFLAHPKQISIH